MKSLREQAMTTSECRGNVFDIKRFATHDGKGIRTTLFLKGCPLRCVWCQNPEGLKKEPQVLYMENKCLHCGSCVQCAKHGGVTIKQQHVCLQREAQEDWERIVDACPTRAMQFDSRSYTVEEVMEELLKDEVFFQREGGITISGGEPFLQHEFLIEILKECKKKQLHTAIESSFYTNWEIIQQALPYLDQIYVDLKVFDSALHKSYTGVDNKQIKENIAFLLQSEKKDVVTIRTPLIPKLTARPDNIAAISTFISNCYSKVRSELLNYNPLAKAKYSYLDMEYCFNENPKLYTNEQMEQFYAIAQTHGIQQFIKE